jgi:short-subunit dehydrogenase
MNTGQGKFALITGATSGIGYELAKLFAKDKYSLVLVARNEQELATKAVEFRERYGIEVVPIVKDLFKHNAPFELYEEVRARGIRVDVLVNDAGHGQYGEFINTDINSELDLIQLNIVSYIVLTKCFLKEMVERKAGKIIQVASIGMDMPGPFQAVYRATKAFVMSFTETVRQEVRDKGVIITALQPDGVDTAFFNGTAVGEPNIAHDGMAGFTMPTSAGMPNALRVS